MILTDNEGDKGRVYTKTGAGLNLSLATHLPGIEIYDAIHGNTVATLYPVPKRSADLNTHAQVPRLRERHVLFIDCQPSAQPRGTAGP